MKNKIVLVTGANTGIGKAAALQLAKQGAHVVLLCRDRSRGEAALKEIQAASGNPNLELLLADLGSLSSIRAAAEAFKKKHERLHVLINNAGLWNRKRETTEDGFEATFGVNHLGPFLLTNLLADVLKASAPARVVNVSSALHYKGRMVWEDLQFERREFSGQEAYSQSKLANVLFTRELSKRLEGSGVSVNAVHPGVIGSDLVRKLPAPLRFILKRVLSSPADGARPLVQLAVAPELEGVTGRYFDKLKEKEPASIAREDWAAARLWDLSAKLTGLAPASAPPPKKEKLDG